ncbi:4903_t:CDS:2 [Dentiscutata erythropus]|uniref:4903_t:CDS:1 n=1 Tax=Dentiscutata erythropus TaxID=1348616 RepID=A0A9N9HWD9_9GLOM|nr:4903_t:CDS:2 [Dentiscutata erythropus]
MGQRFGTEKVASLFSPIVAIWFTSLSVIGIMNINKVPIILKAINPYYAIMYIKERGFGHLDGVLLVFVGSEAVFADLGHFNRRSIQISFPLFVYFPLLLTYLGQGASLILDPSNYKTTFWSSIPDGGVYWFILIIATLTSIIASQAMITATFSLIYQSIQLDCFPRIKGENLWISYCHGDVYNDNSCINLFLVSNAQKILTGAWLTLSVATFLFIIMGLWRWGTVHKVEYETIQSTNLGDIFEVIHHATPRSSIEARYSADSTLLAERTSVNSLEATLHRNIRRQFGKKSKSKIRMLDSGIYIRRLPGIVLFYSDVGSCIPLSFTHFINHFPALPQIIIFMSVHHVAIPHVSEVDRLIISKIGEYDGCYQVVARYGYMEDVIHGDEFITKLVFKIQRLDKHLSEKLDLDELPVTYILGKQIFHPKPNSPRWRRLFVNLYSILAHNSKELYSSWYIPSENFIGVDAKPKSYVIGLNRRTKSRLATL